jgi:hypothetical protein
MHTLAAGYNIERDNLSILCYSLNLLYRYRDKIVYALAGVDKKEKFLFGQNIFLRILFRVLDCSCIGCDNTSAVV